MHIYYLHKQNDTAKNNNIYKNVTKNIIVVLNKFKKKKKIDYAKKLVFNDKIDFDFKKNTIIKEGRYYEK